jgi:hypothetical protein
MTIIDPSILINALLQVAAALVLALGTLAITKLTRWLGLQGDAAARAAFDEVLQKAVTFGLQQTQAQIARHGWDDPTVKTTALGFAAPYVQRFPDVLKALKVDRLDAAQLNAAILQALDRAYPHAAAVAASSPATPSVTAKEDLPAPASALVAD